MAFLSFCRIFWQLLCFGLGLCTLLPKLRQNTNNSNNKKHKTKNTKCVRFKSQRQRERLRSSVCRERGERNERFRAEVKRRLRMKLNETRLARNLRLRVCATIRVCPCAWVCVRVFLCVCVYVGRLAGRTGRWQSNLGRFLVGVFVVIVYISLHAQTHARTLTHTCTHLHKARGDTVTLVVSCLKFELYLAFRTSFINGFKFASQLAIFTIYVNSLLIYLQIRQLKLPL